MNRNLLNMSKNQFDLIIIGGGITGATIAWDASLRGLKVALFEKDDFSQATSSATSKLIHGGLRYLKSFQFGIVRESLKERRILEKIAPHLVHPIPFLIPLYSNQRKNNFLLILGMFVYDCLAYDRKWLADKNKRISGFKWLDKEKVLLEEPGIDSTNLIGGIKYYDCQMFSPNRLTLEFIRSAVDNGAQVANYAHVLDIEKDEDKVKGVLVRDSLDSTAYSIKSNLIINATGPWANQLNFSKSKKEMVFSKGIHIISPQITQSNALVLTTRKKRHIFTIPWRGHSIIGTTDKVFDDSPDQFFVSENDILELIDEFNESCPSKKIKREDVLFYYGGLRSLIKDLDDSLNGVYSASRKYEIFESKEFKGLISVLGGKYTTSRSLAKKVVDLAYQKLRIKKVTCKTHIDSLVGGQIEIFDGFVKEKKEIYKEIPSKAIESLCKFYGTRIDELFSEVPNKYFFTIQNRDLQIMAQIYYAIHFEMARRLSDVVYRRTGIGTIGNPGVKVITEIADLMAQELSWSEDQKKKEVDIVMNRFKVRK